MLPPVSRVLPWTPPRKGPLSHGHPTYRAGGLGRDERLGLAARGGVTGTFGGLLFLRDLVSSVEDWPPPQSPLPGRHPWHRECQGPEREVAGDKK